MRHDFDFMSTFMLHPDSVKAKRVSKSKQRIMWEKNNPSLVRVIKNEVTDRFGGGSKGLHFLVGYPHITRRLCGQPQG